MGKTRTANPLTYSPTAALIGAGRLADESLSLNSARQSGKLGPAIWLRLSSSTSRRAEAGRRWRSPRRGFWSCSGARSAARWSPAGGNHRAGGRSGYRTQISPVAQPLIGVRRALQHTLRDAAQPAELPAAPWRAASTTRRDRATVQLLGTTCTLAQAGRKWQVESSKSRRRRPGPTGGHRATN